MSTPEFTDPRHIVMYDAVNSYEPETQPDFYLGVAEELSAETVIDLGCGTGIITLEFARRGYRMIGVDPSPAMLEVARQSPERTVSSGSRGVPDNWERQALT